VEVNCTKYPFSSEFLEQYPSSTNQFNLIALCLFFVQKQVNLKRRSAVLFLHLQSVFCSYLETLSTDVLTLITCVDYRLSVTCCSCTSYLKEEVYYCSKPPFTVRFLWLLWKAQYSILLKISSC
jgi:hypothetical protein